MKKTLTTIFLMAMMSLLFAQMRDNRDRNFIELDTITVSGTAIVVELDSLHSIYYLDENSDGIADYHLNFGPYWYIPDSSNAVRPVNGESISVLGGLRDSSRMEESTIIVYELNGEFWRDPFFSDWNNLGRRDHKIRNPRHGRSSYGFGWEHDTLETLTVSGTALIDSTYYMNHYYLDTNADGVPDYSLNFGPFWFLPESGAIRPLSGETVEIVGGQLETSMLEPMIIVYEINGLLWRDSSSIGNHFGGGWANGTMDSSRTFHSPFDRGDQIRLHSGWNESGGRGHMGDNSRLPDSLFCQLFEIAPENISNRNGMNVFASYEINMLSSDGTNMLMNDNMMMSRKMSLGNSADYSFHYSDLQMEIYNGDESEIVVQGWDDVTESWTIIDATVDTYNNTVTFSSPDVNNLIVLSANKVTSVENETTTLPSKFALSQNYPNPFNPTTKIAFTLNNNAQVSLTVYNIVGEKVATLISDYKNAGEYSVDFNASQLSSGVYFYELKADATRLVKKMSLLK